MLILLCLCLQEVEAQVVCAEADCDSASLCGEFAITANNVQNEQGYYPAGTSFDICFTAISYENIGGNWLHAVVPVLGAGWVGAAQGADPGISCGGGCDWTWNASGVIGTGGAATTIIQPGWFVESQTTGADLPPSLPTDPGDNWGDSSIDGETFCFTATSANEGPACVEDLSIQMRFYTDSETGSHESPGCSFGPLTYDLNIQCCPVFVIANSGETICAGVDFQPEINIYAPLAGTYDIVWTSDPPEFVNYLTDPFNLPPTLNVPVGSLSGAVSLYAEITDGGCGFFNETLSYTVEDPYFEVREETCEFYYVNGELNYDNLQINAGASQTAGGNYTVSPTANVNLATGTIFGVGLTAQDYTVTYTSPNGCSYSDVFVVNASPSPVAEFAYDVGSLCLGETAMATLPAGTSTGGEFSIVGASNGASIDSNTGAFTAGETAGTFQVAYTTPALATTGSCEAVITADIEVQASNSISYPSTTFCEGDLFSPPAAMNPPNPLFEYEISAPGVISPGSGVIDIQASGTGDFTVSLSGNCSSSITVSILEQATGELTLLGSNALCEGDPASSILLEVTGGSPLYTVNYTNFDGQPEQVLLTGDSFSWQALPGDVGTFTVNSITEANGCISFVEESVSLAGCSCPAVSDLNFPAMQSICAGETFDGSVAVDDAALEAQWYVNGEPLAPGPNLVYFPEPSDCNSLFDISVDVFCIDDGSIVLSQSGEGILVGDWSPNVVETGCSISISNLCEGMEATWDDGTSTGTGTVYTAAEASDGTVSWTVIQEQLGQPIPCLFDHEFESDFGCAANCPTVNDYGLSASDICAGETLTLSADISDPSQASVIWTYEFDGSTYEGSSVDLTVLAGSGCQELQDISILVSCLADGSMILNEGIQVEVYGSIDANIEVSDACTVNISQDCPEYTATWSDGSTAGSGFSATFVGGEVGQVDFTVVSNVAPGACNTEVITVDYECALDCPIVYAIELDAESICSGSSLSGFANVSDESLATVSWSMPDGTTLDTYGWTNEYSSASGCAETISISCTVTCLADGSELASQSFEVPVYPEITGVVVNGECTALFLGDCPEYEVSWQAGAESGAGASFTADLEQSGTVDFTASNAGIPAAPNACLMQTFAASYDCQPDCPIFIEAVSDASVFCEGETASFSVAVSDESLAEVNWLAPDGTSSSGFSTSAIVGISGICPDDFSMQYEIFCSVDGSLLAAGWVPVTVYPTEPVLTINSTNCLVSIESDCAEFGFEWIDNEGNTGMGDYSPEPGASGNLAIAVQAVGAPAGCELGFAEQAYSCLANCPTVVDVFADASVICEGESLALIALLSDTTDASILWTMPDGGSASFFEISYTPEPPTDCVSTLDFDYELFCNADGSSLGSGSLSVDQLKSLSYTVSDNGCNISLSQDCPNFEATWSTEVSDGSGFVFEASEGSSGPLDFVLSNNDPNCPEQLDIALNWDCEQVCPQMVINGLLDPVINICDSAGLDLNFLAAQIVTDLPDATSFVWYDGDGNLLEDSNQVFEHSGQSCEPEYFNFSVEVQCEADPTVALDAGGLVVELYPLPRAEWFGLSAPECVFGIVDSCSQGQLDIQYSFDDGMTFIGEADLPADMSIGDDDIAMSVQIAIEGSSPACMLVGEYVISCPCDRPDAPEIGPSSIISCDSLNVVPFTTADMEGLEIRWYDEADEQVATGSEFVPLEAGEYYAVYVGNEACPSFSSSAVSLIYGENAIPISFDYGQLSYIQGQDTDPSVQILPDLGGSYSSTAGLVLDSVSGDIDLNNSLAGVYEVFYISDGLCEETFSQTLIIQVPVQPFVNIANAFSPNGDNINDVFRVLGNGIESLELMIYDRWGMLLYQTTAPGKGWDGSYKGEMQPVGVYVYMAWIKTVDGEDKFQQGNLTLIR